MPASVADPVALVLRTALSGKKGPYSQEVENESSDLLEDKLTASAKRVLLSTIEYEPAPKQQVVPMDSLKTKYTLLSAAHSSKAVTTNGSTLTPNHEALPPPKVTLFRNEDVKVGWKGSVPVGSGMVNMGNTCYMNSTLQALFHVPSLSNWLTNGRPCKSCEQSGSQLCVVCVIAKTLQSTHEKSGSVVKPILVYNRLKMICKHMVHGRQEDAHEFMRYLVEAMEKAYLQSVGGTKLDSRSKETNPLGQIFGGYIRTEVTCLKCKHISTTFQHFQDIPLDIQHASTLDDALAYYFRRERLEGDNAYKCEKCKCKVPATKKFSIERAPNVLCIQLKRFGLLGGKMSKHVQFSRSLNLNRFLFHQIPGSCSTYKFVSLINHMGPSQHCGHYTAIAEASNGQLYLFDDCSVRLISLNVALSTGAYVLIYEKIQSTTSPSSNGIVKSTEKFPNGVTHVTNGMGKIGGKSIPSTRPPDEMQKSSDKGLFVPISSSIGVHKPNENSQKTMITPSKEIIHKPALISEPPRSKIAIELKKPENAQKPRLVIRNGITSLFKSTTPISASINKESTSKSDLKSPTEPLSNNLTKSLAALVPYENESSEEENEKEIPANSNQVESTSNIVKSTEAKWQISPSPTPSDLHASNSCLGSIAKWQISDSSQQDNSSSSTSESTCSGNKWVVRSLSDTETEKSNPQKRQKICHSDTEMDPPSKRLPTLNKISETIRNIGEKIFGPSDKIAETEILKETKNKHSSATVENCQMGIPEQSGKTNVPDENNTATNLPNANLKKCTTVKWDGSRNGDTVKELLRMSHSGFSDQVRTWDGGKSHLTKQVEDDRRLQRKRTADEVLDEEMDKGKVKKVRAKDANRELNSSSSNYNPFQAFQNRQREQHFQNNKNDNSKKNHFHNRSRHNYHTGGKGKSHRNDHHRSHSKNHPWRRFR